MKGRKQLKTVLKLMALELFSSILFALSIPNELFMFGLPLAGFFTLIPHYIALKQARSIKVSCLLCFIQCFFTHIFTSFWLANFKNFAIFTLGASALGTGAIHAMFAILFFMPSFVQKLNPFSDRIKKSFARRESRILWFAAVYTIFEYAKCTGFLSYPWGTLPMSCYRLKLLSQITDITGVRGLTFIICLVSGTAAEFILDAVKVFKLNSTQKQSAVLNFKLCIKEACRLNFNNVAAILIVLALSLVYGAFQYYRPIKPVKSFNAALIQENYDPWLVQEDAVYIHDSQRITLDAIADFRKRGLEPDLVVWSEGILHFPLPEGIPHYSRYPTDKPLIPFIKETGCPTIIGAPYTINFEELRFSNSAFLFDKDGSSDMHYEKIKLIPFAEHIPFTQYKIVRRVLKRLVGFSSGWIPGSSYSVFTIPLNSNKNENLKLCIPICFEDAFGFIHSNFKKLGAEVFVNITDDSWSLTKSAEYQHFVVSWFRAIEFRTTMVRSTNSGFTAIVDPQGRIKDSLPLFKEAWLSAEVPVYKNVKTVYMMLGEWVSFTLFIFIVFVSGTIIFLYHLKKFCLCYHI